MSLVGSVLTILERILKLLPNIASGLRSLFRKGRVEKELDEELSSFLDMAAEEKMKQGMSRKDALRAVRLERGSLEVTKEVVRSARWESLVETLWHDLRFAARMLRKSPGFTVIAVLTLALGIGANTAIFSLLNGLALRNLPVPHPEQLVRFGAHTPDDDFTALSLPMFQEFSRSQKVFSGTFAWWGDIVLNVETDGALSRADVWAVDGNFYPELGAVPGIGRLFNPAEEDVNAATAAQVAVLGYGFWQSHYGGARDVIGKTLKIEGMPFTIIGVTRKGFTGMSAALELEVTVPITAVPVLGGKLDIQKSLQRRDTLWLEGAGRLRSDVAPEQARAQLESLWPGIQKDMAPLDKTPAELNHFRELRLKVESGAKGGSLLRHRFVKPLSIVLAISGLVLFIACVNLASLMLARAASRHHEMGMRLALGASRGRLASQMLTESITLSVAGSLAGWVLAYWASRALASFILGEIYIVPAAALNLSPDWRILGFTAGATIVTGVLFGLAPAWRASREDPNAALQQSSRTLGGQAGGLGKGLIVAQVALSLILLVGAGLFIRTMQKLSAVEPGFRTRAVLDVSLFPKPDGYKNLARVSYYRELTDRVSRLPGIACAGIMHARFGNVLEWTERARITGTDAEGLQADFEMAMPGFFETAGIGLLRGRGFNWQDDEQAPRVAIVSKNFAEKLFPAGDAIGQHLDVTTMPKWQNLQIVGVVSNASLYDIRKQQPPTVYLPSMQYGDYMGWSQLLVQTNVPPAKMSGALRQTVASLGHEYVTSIKTVRQNIDRSLLQDRVTAMLSTFFGALTLLLAAIGLYGLMAYTVTQRTREIGIRLALGAARGRVLKMILRETLALVIAGVLIGVPCALAASQLIAHMLFGLSPNDPTTLTFVAGALLAVGILAGFLPARRAMRVDPMVALRHE
jgi:putative ABC transport system permease protein